MQKLTILIILLGLGTWCKAQKTAKIPLPKNMEQSYPRIYVTQSEKAGLEKTIQSEEWAKNVISGIHRRIDKYVERHADDPRWMPSRLQMYWKTKAANVYVNGIYYSHADGRAPVPTVRFTGSRDHTSDYAQPALEDVLPYMDDERGLYLPNKTKEGHPFEWVEQSKTGGIVHRLNQKITGLARDAAFLYWLENDENYAQFAFDIFDTYMQGMHYRSEPIDLLNGHIQTLVGLTCFQVIHESTLINVAELYDFLHQYIEKNHPEKIEIYEAVIKKWNDLIIKNGVPQNNWNLHQAKIILKAAMVLKDNSFYSDGKGREYYIDYILNLTSARQWSLGKFMDYGYDENNGVWAECPGYAMGVTKDLANFVSDFDNAFDHNILPYVPVINKAVKVLPQYLFPNGQTAAFGDSYYGQLSTEAMGDMIRLAKKKGNKELEREFTGMYRLFSPNAGNMGQHSTKADVSSLFADKPLELNPNFKAAKLSDYITQTFYAPNVSWHVQRTGMGTEEMMVSLNGSLGNHMHANGISMELYGKGFVQGADPGKGSGYLQPIYLEYYSQFPAHNTVMVDGVSSYTEMLSHHAFDLMGEYPQSEQKTGYCPNITYADVYFLEPESQSDQNRTVSIVKTAEGIGYYVDIFRSRKQRGGDKFHDYFYHNLGQKMQVTDATGKPLALKPSGEMGFAGGHLYAFDYMWDKKSVSTNEDYRVQWQIEMPATKDDVFMDLWMRGSEGRKIFAIKSPPCKSFRGNGGLPYEPSKKPYLTFVARQYGEAWEHPFVSVYEPFTAGEGKSVVAIEGFDDENGNKDFAGIRILNKSGREDFILSSYAGKTARYKAILSDAAYALVGNEKNGDCTLFMGNGTQLKAGGFVIFAQEKGNVVLEKKENAIYLHNEVSVSILYQKQQKTFQEGTMRKIEF